LENWSAIQETLRDSLKQLSAYLNGLDPNVVIAALALPVVLAAISGRISAIVAAALLAAVTLVLLVEPGSLAMALLAASYLGSLLAAAAGLCAWRRSRGVKRELAALRADLDHLVQAESHRMMAELRSGKDRDAAGAAQNAASPP
jgi:hypothetical protein